MMKTAAYLLRAAMIAAALLMATSGMAEATNYGAIAYSPSSGARAYSTDYSTRAGAETRALNECRARGRGCKIVMWFKNACGALAVGNGGGWGSAWAGSRQAAENRAIDNCSAHAGGCSVRTWVCTSR